MTVTITEGQEKKKSTWTRREENIARQNDTVRKNSRVKSKTQECRTSSHWWLTSHERKGQARRNKQKEDRLPFTILVSMLLAGKQNTHNHNLFLSPMMNTLAKTTTTTTTTTMMMLWQQLSYPLRLALVLISPHPPAYTLHHYSNMSATSHRYFPTRRGPQT